MSVPPGGTRAPRWRSRWQGARARLSYSLRWRLVGLFVLLALATVVVFVVGMQQVMRGGWRDYARPLAKHYLDLAVADLGTPPSIDKAAAMAARLPLHIRIDGPTVQWDSDPGRPPAEARRWRGRGAEADDGGAWQTRVLADGHRVTFRLAQPPHELRARGFGWATLGVLLLLVAIAWRGVSRLLRPIEGIRAGVQRYGQGDFSTPIAMQRRDELGLLARQVDTMAADLQRMLEAKRGLLLAISHELRSPLTRARVHAELVEDGPARDGLLRDLGEMRDLIADLLDSERLAAGHAALQTEPTDLAALVRDAAADAPPGTVALALEDGLPPMPLDRTRLRLLLRNLLGNAQRHAGGAPVTLSLRRDGLDAVCLTVRDRGPGVGDDQLARLAEPFYRTDGARLRRSGGVGLGLYLCRLVAEAHGGTLSFHHAAPGLAVELRLPAGS
ncbi:HAMP domain-containing sensor histidine kinase [Aquincola sp. MAHUQ-54]|uniref:histidine kinase n=1 Tax=Aquincola agrisoli TaxID=3119538 RepID=A0AAW9QJ90_9BURK